MNWFGEAWKHIQLLNHRHQIHIRAYGSWGGKKYWIPPVKNEEDMWALLSPIYGKHFNDNISIGLSDYVREKEYGKMDYEPESVCVIVLDFDRADKSRFDGKYLSEMAREVEDFRKFLALKCLKRGSLLMSGTGFHLYLPIPRIHASYEAFEAIKELEKWLWEEFSMVANPEHIELDNGIDPKKVMRLAGTYNRKAGQPRMAKWVDYSGYVPDHKLLTILKFVR